MWAHSSCIPARDANHTFFMSTDSETDTLIEPEIIDHFAESYFCTSMHNHTNFFPKTDAMEPENKTHCLSMQNHTYISSRKENPMEFQNSSDINIERSQNHSYSTSEMDIGKVFDTNGFVLQDHAYFTSRPIVQKDGFDANIYSVSEDHTYSSLSHNSDQNVPFLFKLC